MVVHGRLATAIPTEKIYHVDILVKDSVFLIFLSIVFKELNLLRKWSNDFVTIGLTLINVFSLLYLYLR